MYKLLLSWRYLLTRYIALASIISVTLGVGTMIVVNAVMLGFTSEMSTRIHGMLSDVIFEVRTGDGIPDPDAHIRRICQIAGDQIEGITPIVNTFGLLRFQYYGQDVTQKVQIIGIDPNTQSDVSDMAKYLQHPANRNTIGFDLHQDGYDVLSSQSQSRPHFRPEMAYAGWGYRSTVVAEREN